MGILQRYIVEELLKVFLLALISLTTILLFIGLGQQAIREGLGFLPLLKAVPYLLPNALRFAIPGTILFSVCSVYGRVSASNELTAIKAAGVSPMALVAPGLVLALVLSLICVWLNDVAVSWGHMGLRHVVMQSIDDIAYSVLRTKKSFYSDKFSILVKDVQGDLLIRPEITMAKSGEQGIVTISAATAQLKSDPEHKRVIVTLTDSRIHSTGPEGRLFEHPGSFVTSIPLEDPTTVDGIRNASHQPMRSLPAWQKKMANYHHQVSQVLAAKGAACLVTGQAPEPSDSTWLYWLNEQQWSKIQISRLKTEPHRRWANGFSCFCFALLGIPLAIRQRSSDFITSFFTAFLPVLLLYYPLMALGVDRAKDGQWPAAMVWLGNVVVIAVGSWLLHRTLKN
ncbi:LptF/LptG family permease [Bremerella sp. JC770]|uniref:LptF/LptG family permease n=1 Tax=Bremerella sp. JC770 TaxID=3232137 RepID=UPI003459F7A4